MTQLNIGIALVGVVILAIGLASNPIKRSLVQEPMLAVLAGLAFGPFGLGWLDVAAWGDSTAILEQTARLTLAIGLMGVALRLEREQLARLWRPVALLLTAVMLAMWLVSSSLAGLVLGTSLWTALLVGAIATPTDPVVASSIVTGPFAKEHLPQRVRQVISAESGFNDGLAYPLVLLPLLMLEHAPAEAWSRWLVDTLLVGVLAAAAIGCTAGFVAARLLALSQRRGMIESPSLLSYTVAFSLATLGAARLVGSDGLLAVFLAGLVFNLCTPERQEHEEEGVQEAVAKLFTLPIFVVFGLALPIGAWAEIGWPLAWLCVLVLVLRRLPAVLCMPGRRLSWRDKAFIGWFGPLGVAAIYYANHASGRLGDPLVWHVSSALICASIFVHGATAAPLTRLYARG